MDKEKLQFENSNPKWSELHPVVGISLLYGTASLPRRMEDV
jgi:hypothetical protein